MADRSDDQPLRSSSFINLRLPRAFGGRYRSLAVSLRHDKDRIIASFDDSDWRTRAIAFEILTRRHLADPSWRAYFDRLRDEAVERIRDYVGTLLLSRIDEDHLAGHAAEAFARTGIDPETTTWAKRRDFLSQMKRHREFEGGIDELIADSEVLFEAGQRLLRGELASPLG